MKLMEKLQPSANVFVSQTLRGEHGVELYTFNIPLKVIKEIILLVDQELFSKNNATVMSLRLFSRTDSFR